MMLHLLSLEWKKLKCYNTFKVLAILYALALPLVFLMFLLLYLYIDDNAPKDAPFDMGTMFIFPEVWDYLGYVGNWLNFFVLGLVSIMLIANDYSFKTFRQNIITGMTRNQYFLGKILMIAALCLAATLYYIFVVMVFGFINTETVFMHKVTQNIDFGYRYFLQCFTYSVFAFMIGCLFRNMALATITYIIYVIFLESVLKVLHFNFITTNITMNLYPMNVTEDLVPIPFKLFREIVNAPFERMGIEVFLTPTQAIIGSLVYASIFVMCSFFLIKRRDL